jgi:hypothetical protein
MGAVLEVAVSNGFQAGKFVAVASDMFAILHRRRSEAFIMTVSTKLDLTNGTLNDLNADLPGILLAQRPRDQHVSH